MKENVMIGGRIFRYIIIKMKTLKIRVDIKDNELILAVEREGFGDDLSADLELIGILEDIKKIVLEKIETKERVDLKKEE